MKFPESGGFFARGLLVGGFIPLARAAQIQKRKASRRNWHAFRELFAKLELLSERLVAAQISALEIIKQPTALTDHDQETTARAVIFLIGLEMLSQMVDALGEQRDLHVGGAGVLSVQLVSFNRLGLRFHKINEWMKIVIHTQAVKRINGGFLSKTTPNIAEFARLLWQIPPNAAVLPRK